MPLGVISEVTRFDLVAHLARRARVFDLPVVRRLVHQVAFSPRFGKAGEGRNGVPLDQGGLFLAKTSDKPCDYMQFHISPHTTLCFIICLATLQ